MCVEGATVNETFSQYLTVVEALLGFECNFGVLGKPREPRTSACYKFPASPQQSGLVLTLRPQKQL